VTDPVHVSSDRAVFPSRRRETCRKIRHGNSSSSPTLNFSAPPRTPLAIVVVPQETQSKGWATMSKSVDHAVVWVQHGVLPLAARALVGLSSKRTVPSGARRALAPTTPPTVAACPQGGPPAPQTCPPCAGAPLGVGGVVPPSCSMSWCWGRRTVRVRRARTCRSCHYNLGRHRVVSTGFRPMIQRGTVLTQPLSLEYTSRAAWVRRPSPVMRLDDHDVVRVDASTAGPRAQSPASKPVNRPTAEKKSMPGRRSRGGNAPPGAVRRTAGVAGKPWA